MSFNDELTTTIYADVEFPSWGKWQIYAEGRLNRYRNNTSYRVAYLELRTRVTHTFAPLRSLSWSLATDHQNIHAIRGYPPIETDPITLPQPATGVLDSVVIDARGDHLLYLRWTGTTAPYGYTRRTLLYSGEQLIETAETGLPVANPVSAQELTATSYPPLRLRPQRVIFGTDPPIPIDTIEVTSAAVIFYTWGPELLHHFNAQLAASGGIGDGTYAVENVIYTNVAGGYGLFVGYATDTLYYTF